MTGRHVTLRHGNAESFPNRFIIQFDAIWAAPHLSVTQQPGQE